MKVAVETIAFPLPADRVFDEIIDVRAPVEYEADHMTGAINLPVLSDDERERIGTQYRHESAFEAQKAGAAIISGNIRRHLEGHFRDKPENYRPLIYCFRGGQRSGSMATVLSEIGWPVAVIDGGYKAYRRHVVDTLERHTPKFEYHVINGLTGSGKTRLLHELDTRGAQVLDLEGLARHKGSVFGEDPANPQPTQKRFESLIFDKLTAFDPAGGPVFVEAESPKIGRLNLPLALRKKLGVSPVTELISPLEIRVDAILSDYGDWLTDPERVRRTLNRLKPFHSCETINRWHDWCDSGQWRNLIAGLLADHYDRTYATGGQGNYCRPEGRIEVNDRSQKTLGNCASELTEESVGA